MDPEPPRKTLDAWIAALLADERFTGMGHAQRPETHDLGLGWLYYALARLLAPTSAVVIGSHRGFVPLLVARALADAGGGGRLVFIDPSLVDDFWKEEPRVNDYFGGLGVTNITHHLQTTQQFVETAAYDALHQVGIVFVDGFHSAAQARFDFEAFAGKLSPEGMILLHSWMTRRRRSKISLRRE